MSNVRKNQRYPADGTIIARFPGGNPSEVRGVATDISSGGCRMEHAGAHPLAIGNVVEITIVDGQGDSVERSSTCVQTSPGATSFRFDEQLKADEMRPFVAVPELDEQSQCEIEQLIEHSRLMWDAELDNHRRFSLRGRVIVGSTSGLLGFVAIGLLVAGSDSRLNLIPVASLQDKLAIATFVSTGAIGLGLFLCIVSVVSYIVHREEDSGLLEIRTEFGPINKGYLATQPNLWSVCPSYLAASFLRHDKGVLFRPLFQWYAFGKGFIHGTKIRTIWGVRTKTRKNWNRTLARIYGVLSMGPWLVFQVLFLLIPGTRISDFLRKSINHQYRQLVFKRAKEDSDRARWIQGRIVRDFDNNSSSSLFSLAYERALRTRQSNPRHPRILPTSSSYYLQFAEGFARKWIGTGTNAEDPLKRENPSVPYSELDPTTSCEQAPPFREPLWRVFVSTYFAAQQLRSSNWNLWFRVRRAERYFTMGVVVIMVGFIATAITGEIVRKEALPSVPLVIENSDGSIPSILVRPDLTKSEDAHSTESTD